MTNNQLTSTHLAVKSELDGYKIHASRGQATAMAMVRLFESIDRDLEELQERRQATMNSEPVAWRRFQETPNDGGYWILYDYRPNCSGVEPLYRHAQPAPVVPDGYVMMPVEPNGDMLAAAQDAYGETDGDIASTLRAAMLAADPQLPGSEPATVPGKWIPVSERMPEDEQEVLTINKMGHRFVSFFDKHSGLFFDRLDAPAACCIEHVLVTHWMTLPAAPQEVKGE